MRLLPDQIPNLIRFLLEYQPWIEGLFMRCVEIQPMPPENQQISSEPCWRWNGLMQIEDHEPLPAIYYEASGGEEPLVRLEAIPHLDLAEVLPAHERELWTAGQKQHLIMPARIIAWLMRQPGAWHPADNLLDERFIASCQALECIQPWHLMALSRNELATAEQYELRRAEVIRSFKEKKRRYEDSVSTTRRFAPGSPQRGGPHLVQGSLEHTRRTDWLALYDVKLQEALDRLRRAFEPDFAPVPRAVPVLVMDKDELARLERYMTKHLDRSGECWTVRPDSKYFEQRQLRFTVHGRVFILKRMLFALHYQREIQERAVIKNGCGDTRCHRPEHQTEVVK